MAQARSKQREAAEGRIESGVPLPPSTDAHDAAVIADLAARTGVGPAALPSCAFATFVNTGQTLTCAAFAPDVSEVAGALRQAISNWSQHLGGRQEHSCTFVAGCRMQDFAVCFIWLAMVALSFCKDCSRAVETTSMVFSCTLTAVMQ